MKRDFDLIIFDLDGTLYPVNREMDRIYPLAAMQLIARKTGRDISTVEPEFLARKAELEQLIGGKPTSTLTLFYYYDVGFEEFETIVDSLIDIEKYIQPDPRAVEIMKSINTHYQLYLYTTNNDKISRRILERIGLSTIFPEEKRFSFSDVGKLPFDHHEKLKYVKPGLKGFQYLLDRFNVSPEKTLMIGDSEVSDILPAQKLNIRTYHVTDRDSFYYLPEWLGII